MASCQKIDQRGNFFESVRCRGSCCQYFCDFDGWCGQLLADKQAAGAADKRSADMREDSRAAFGWAVDAWMLQEREQDEATDAGD